MISPKMFSSDKTWDPLNQRKTSYELSFDIWTPRDSVSNSYFSLFGGWHNSTPQNCSTATHAHRELLHRVSPHAVMKVIGAGGSIIQRVQSSTSTVIVSPHRNQADKVFRISARHPNPQMAQQRVDRAQELLQTLEDVTMCNHPVRHPHLLPRVHWLLDETAEQTGLISPGKQHQEKSRSPSPITSDQLLLRSMDYCRQQLPTDAISNSNHTNWLLANHLLRQITARMG